MMFKEHKETRLVYLSKAMHHEVILITTELQITVGLRTKIGPCWT